MELWDLGGSRGSMQMQKLSANPESEWRSCVVVGRVIERQLYVMLRWRVERPFWPLHIVSCRARGRSFTWAEVMSAVLPAGPCFIGLHRIPPLPRLLCHPPPHAYTRRTRAGVIKSCRFLGRAEVPLSETLDVPAGTPLWFDLMRRGAADAVSGQLQLRWGGAGCRIRVLGSALSGFVDGLAVVWWFVL